MAPDGRACREADYTDPFWEGGWAVLRRSRCIRSPCAHGYRGHTVALVCSHRRPVRGREESGVVFDGVRLDEGDDWCDYDEKAEASLTVGREVRYEFRRL